MGILSVNRPQSIRKTLGCSAKFGISPQTNSLGYVGFLSTGTCGSASKDHLAQTRMTHMNDLVA